MLDAYDYYPFGLPMPSRNYGSGTRERFTGQEHDSETGLDYFGARYYMPAYGRWASVDPAVEKYPGMSPYVYVLNDPATLTDSNGKEACCVKGILRPGESVGIYLQRRDQFRAQVARGSYLKAAATFTLAPLEMVGNLASELDPFGMAGFASELRVAGEVPALAEGIAKSADDLAAVGQKVFNGLGDGTRLSTDAALQKAEEFLGQGYKETPKGIFISADGTRRVRMTDSDLSGHGGKIGSHANFETGKTVVDRKGRSAFKVDENKHIYFQEEGNR